jgi:glycosyltransferase involved in cell wall biosynthesis
MISVVIPLYNKEKYVANTLQSVLSQTFTDFEVVIVNDGSTDNSVAEVQKWQDSRIRLVHQENAGVSAARNKGIAEARYDLIAFLDADDEWKPEYLQTQYELSRKYPEGSVFACNYEFRDGDGKIRPTIIRKLPFDEQDGILTNYFEVAACSHPPICSISIVVRKEAVLSVGGFPVGIESGEDLLTWAKLAVRYPIVYSKKILAVFISTPSDGGKSKAQMRNRQEDFVLTSLLKLYNSTIKVEKKYLKSYIIRWYRIQSIIKIEIKENKNAFHYAFSALKFGGCLKDFLPIMILSIMPPLISLKLLNAYKKAK